MKCLIVLWFMTTNEMKEMVFHASNCDVVYEMVQSKMTPDVQVISISDYKDQPNVR